MLKWFEETGDNEDVVISSRVRLARNLSNYPFPVRMSSEQSEQLVEELKNKLANLKDEDRRFHYISMKNISDADKVALVERHLVSDTLIMKAEPAGAVLSEDEAVSILLNEEDHIRIQALAGGMNLEKAWRLADKLDDEINKSFSYAYHDKLGYLTSFPTNVGTGLRASFILHLPAMSGTKRLAEIASDIGRFGVTIRGNEAGNLYQIYNQKTLGQTEQEIIKNLTTIAEQIIKQERRIRKKLVQENPVRIEDTLLRSYGILKYCKSLEIEEAMNLLSDIQFGLASGILKLEETVKKSVYPLMMGIQPAHLQRMAGKPLDKKESDIVRAGYIKENLPGIAI
ncbi:MAG: protein arginine kinase [Lachnospiraceae bacterium]|nr:protein arginine kinase [Lachnospiraceae bacterium]